MKVSILVMQNFLNDSRVIKQATSLLNVGYDVKVVALHEDGLKCEEEIEGIKVKRVVLKTKKLPRNIFTNLLKYLEHGFKTYKVVKKSDVFVSSSIEPLPLVILYKLLSFNRKKVIFDARELETEKNGLKGMKKKIITILENLLMKNVDGLMTVSGKIQDFYEKKYRRRVFLVRNTPTLRAIGHHDKFRERFSIDAETKIFLYQGALTKGRGLEEIIHAFTKCDFGVNLIIMGYGPLEKFVKEVSRENENIHFHEAVSPDKLLNFTSSADYGFCLIQNTCLSYYYCLPNKFFEYSMAGIPVIASDFPELRSYVEEFKNGLLISDYNEKSILKAINEIIRMNSKQLSLNARCLADGNNWSADERELIEMFSQL